MGRAAVTEARTKTRTGDRARLELTMPVALKTALAHAALDRGVTIAALVEEAIRAHPDVSKRVERLGVGMEDV